jgi:hypothetical protein
LKLQLWILPGQGGVGSLTCERHGTTEQWST